MPYLSASAVVIHYEEALYQVYAGRSGLAVACLTAVREVLGSHNHCDLQPWARAVYTLPAVPRSTQPSTPRGTVNEYQLSG